jgi:addiction module HigA family antidote
MAARKIRLAHPGKILREEFMEPVGLSAYALAKALGVPLPRVNDIVREKRSISPEMAVLLSAYFGTSGGYWINLQAHYDLERAAVLRGSSIRASCRLGSAGRRCSPA